MKICFLYGNSRALSLAEWLISEGHEVVTCSSKLETLSSQWKEVDMIVSFTYRYKLSEKVINEVGGKAVNIHISLLPWNRGADPNIWSWVDDTPKGVTLHYITDNLDSGDIITQRITIMSREETLESSCCKLMADAEQLFIESFPLHHHWNGMRKRAIGKGSYHCLADLKTIRAEIDYTSSVNSFLKWYHSRVDHAI